MYKRSLVGFAIQNRQPNLALIERYIGFSALGDIVAYVLGTTFVA